MRVYSIVNVKLWVSQRRRMAHSNEGEVSVQGTETRSCEVTTPADVQRDQTRELPQPGDIHVCGRRALEQCQVLHRTPNQMPERVVGYVSSTQEQPPEVFGNEPNAVKARSW